MTTVEFYTNKLVENGLSKDEAEKIMTQHVANDKNMHGRWNDLVMESDELLLRSVWITVKQTAKDWLVENKPMHFARPMFD